MLKLALTRDRKLGLNQALITCDDNNTSSIKIIESAGGWGVLYGKFKDEDEALLIRHYWIKL